MLDQYKISGPVTTIEFQIEQDVIETLAEMEKYSKLTKSELTNMALKRFIASHKDFLPKRDRTPE